MGVRMHIISSIWYGIQRHLFPFLEEDLGPLTEFHRKVAATLEIVRIEEGISYEYWFGRPTSSRKSLGRAFVAKAVSNGTLDVWHPGAHRRSTVAYGAIGKYCFLYRFLPNDTPQRIRDNYALNQS